MDGSTDGRATGAAGRGGTGKVAHAASIIAARLIPAMVINRIPPLCGGEPTLARPSAGMVRQRKPIATRPRQR